MACKTPVAALTPVMAPARNAVLSSPESPRSKKLCVHKMVAERLQSASMVIMEPDYKDALLIGYKGPDLSEVMPWIRFEAQNMMELPWWTEMVSIKQDKNIRYIAKFQCWKVRSGLWPSLPRCNFILNQEISDTVDLCLVTKERWTRGPCQRIYSRTVTERVSSSISPLKEKTLIYMQIKLVYMYIKLI